MDPFIKFVHEAWSNLLPLALLAALFIRFALGVAGWVDVAALLITAALVGVLAVRAQQARAQEELEAAAIRAAEARNESKLLQALSELEALRAKVTRLSNMATLS